MRQDELYHYGVKGMKWKNHKYVRLVNGEYVYGPRAMTAEQRLNESRKYKNETKQQRDEAIDLYEYSLKRERQAKEKYGPYDSRTREWAHATESNLSTYGSASTAANKAELAYKNALRKYKKSPMRKMKIAVRVGKARATNAIRHINERQDARKNERQTNRKNRQVIRNRQYKTANKKPDLQLSGGVSVTYSEPVIKRKKR